MVANAPPLADLYLEDETAWLERMARLAAARRVADLDLPNLSEYLHSMAQRDRRETGSRLLVLLTHLLKWEHQPDKRSGSWEASIKHQRRELRMLLENGSLRNHAAQVLEEVFRWAVDEASTETGLPMARFPAECPYSLDDLLEE